MATKVTRGIPGDGYLTVAKNGKTVYRWPKPKQEGRERAGYYERTVPEHLLAKGQRRALDTWKQAQRATMALERATMPQEEPETVGRYLQTWLAELPSHLAPNTRANRRSVIERHLIPALGKEALADLSPRRIEMAIRGLGLAPSSAREVRNVLVNALNDAVRLEILPRNPAALARAPRQVRVDRPRFDAAQVRRLVLAAAGERLGAVLLLAGALGLRRGELLGLRWRDIDLDAGSLKVAVQRQRENGLGMVERPPKSNSGRTIPLPGMVVESLRAHRDRQRWERSQPGYRDYGLVFARPDGRPATTEMVDDLRRRVRDRANEGVPEAEQFPPFRLHDLRASAASVLLALGVPLPAVASILGHAHQATTLAYYTAALPDDVKEAAERMHAALSVGESMGGVAGG